MHLKQYLDDYRCRFQGQSLIIVGNSSRRVTYMNKYEL